MKDAIDGRNVTEKGIAQSGPLAGALNESGNVDNLEDGRNDAG
jgi:hypothetical protein